MRLASYRLKKKEQAVNISLRLDDAEVRLRLTFASHNFRPSAEKT